MQYLTSLESEDQQRRVAGLLRERGLAPGDRVVISATPSTTLLSAILGALRTGVVPVLINPSLLDHESDLLIEDAQASLVINNQYALEALLGAEPVELSPVPLARPMHYTSGTTGRPKGVWSGVLDDAQGHALLEEEVDLWGFQAGDVHLLCAPMHHSAPVRFAAGTLLAGGAVIVLPRFDAASVVEAIDQYHPTSTFMAPVHLKRLFDYFEHNGSVPDLSSFRLIAHAGSPCPEPLKRRALDVFPKDSVWEFYGSTEGQFTACSSGQWLENPGTVGRARPGRVISVDSDGVLWCATPSHARFTYWRDEQRTSEAWRGDAFSVGDIGHINDEGFVFLDGRRDDLIITGGVNVYPVEVEQELGTFPGVTQVAVFGVDDELWGRRVCAAVVGDIDLEALSSYIRTRLAGYKCPKNLISVTDIPHSETGKVCRSTLAADLGLE